MQSGCQRRLCRRREPAASGHSVPIIVRPVDREAVARSRRRRQVEEALEDERGRDEALTDRLEEVVAEELGGRIDEHAFSRMEPEDVTLVREVLDPPSGLDEDEDDPGATYEDDGPDEDDVEEEIARLQAEIADSRRRQLAFRRYLEALDG
jgi:hypothetical protein